MHSNGVPLVHLYPGQRVIDAAVDDAALDDIVHLAPLSRSDTVHHYFPFGGAGSHPPFNTGHVAEVRLPSAAERRTLSVTVG